MKKLLTFLSVLFITCSGFAIDLPKDVLSLYKQKDYFKLKEHIASDNLNTQQKLFLSAIVDCAFCRNKESEAEINKYLNDYPIEYSDTLFGEFIQLQVDNYVKLNNYAYAAETAKMIIEKFQGALKPEDIKDLKNNYRILKPLAGIKKQQITGEKNKTIEFKRDIANLMNIDVECNSVKSNAVFDTGANLSVIADSLAQKMGLKTLGDSIVVKAVTGAEVIAKIAVADKLNINGITVSNALFLVFPDEALSFGPVYKINMIIGFPVIKDLGQIQFDLASKKIIVSDINLTENSNLFIDGLTPVIQVKFENDILLFSFDSGAKTTHYNKLFSGILEKYPAYKIEEDTVKVGGAGGIKTQFVYKTGKTKLTVLNKETELNNIHILKEDFIDNSNKLHGNLGQDVISSGKGFVIDFNRMVFKILE